MVKKSHRVRTPRSAASHRFAIVAAVVLPSAMAVNTSSSTAVFSASVCWCAFMALKKRSGVGCYGGMAVAIDISLSGKGMRSLNQTRNACVSIIFLPILHSREGGGAGGAAARQFTTFCDLLRPRDTTGFLWAYAPF